MGLVPRFSTFSLASCRSTSPLSFIMVAFNKFFTSVFLAIVYASSSLAAPSPIDSKHMTHRTREIAGGITLETFHPASNYEVGHLGFKFQFKALILPFRRSAKELTTRFANARA